MSKHIPEMGKEKKTLECVYTRLPIFFLPQKKAFVVYLCAPFFSLPLLFPLPTVWDDSELANAGTKWNRKRRSPIFSFDLLVRTTKAAKNLCVQLFALQFSHVLIQYPGFGFAQKLTFLQQQILAIFARDRINSSDQCKCNLSIPISFSLSGVNGLSWFLSLPFLPEKKWC